jgi:DNA-binding IclR family transcriptional regulator
MSAQPWEEERKQAVLSAVRAGYDGTAGIARRTGLSPGTARRLVLELQAAGEVRVELAGGKKIRHIAPVWKAAE